MTIYSQIFHKFRINIYTNHLHSLLKRLKFKTIAIVQQYNGMYDKIADVPISIEHVMEIKKFIEDVPNLVKSLEEQMRTTLFEYEILDYFWYSLSDDDFYLKWDAVAWPMKILKQISIVKDTQDADIDKFLKQQVADEGMYTVKAGELIKKSSITAN